MKKPSSTLLRTLSAVAVIALVCLGLAIHTGFGTPSSWGIADIAALCPLGAIEAAIASRTVVPPMLLGAVIVVVLTIVFGRAFCAWGCPIPLLRRVLGLKSPQEKRAERERKLGKRAACVEGEEREKALKELEGVAVEEAEARLHPGETIEQGALGIPRKLRGGIHDSRNWVLGGTILSTALFGFPVFCLICPVGLTFGTIIVLWRLFQFNEATLSLVVFPALLLLEIVVLRKWCHRFCPLGALFSLIARLNRTFRPRVDTTTCLRENGEACHRCAEVCEEGIDLHDGTVSAPLSECTKCRVCADRCPAHAISFPLLNGGFHTRESEEKQVK